MNSQRTINKFNYQGLFKSYWQGKSIKEVEIDFIPRTDGVAKGTRTMTVFKSVIDLFRLWFKWIIFNQRSVTKIGTIEPDLCGAVTYTYTITNTAAGATAIDVDINIGVNIGTTTTPGTNPLRPLDVHDNRRLDQFSFDGGINYFIPAALPADNYAGSTINIPSNFLPLTLCSRVLLQVLP